MVDESCKRCYFFAYAGSVPICDYIGITNHSRPCPSGQECNVKAEGTFPESTQERRRLYQIHGCVVSEPEIAMPTVEQSKPGRKPTKAATPEEEAKREHQRALRRARMKKYREKHREQILKYQREWYAKNVKKNK